MTTIAENALAIERLCDEIEVMEDNGDAIPTDMIAKFAAANLAMAAKTDRWIGFMEAVASRLEVLKDRKRATMKAIKAGETMQKGLKDYLKHCLLEFAEGEGKRVPFVGSHGRLYLHNNPPAIKVTLTRTDKTIYKCIDPMMIHMDETIRHYAKPVTTYILDTDQLEADLKAGKKLSWASIEQDCHVRIKG